MMTEKEKIASVNIFIKSLCTEDIVRMFNEFCSSNQYSEICYPMSEFDDVCSNLKPTELLTRLIDTNFSIRDNYFWMSDCQDIYSFDYYDDDDSPIDTYELARIVVTEDYDYGNSSVREFLDSLEEEEEGEE